MRAFVVVNPAAGGGRTAGLWPSLRERFEAAGIEIVARTTGGPGDAIAIARGAVDDGWPLVVAVGGDGTVNEVVTGVMAAGNTDAAVGIVATGRGRDVCRNLGLARDPVAAVGRLGSGDDVRVDAGVLTRGDGRTHYFINAAGIGFDAAVAARTAQTRGGRLPYLRATVAALAAHDPVTLTLGLDGRSRTKRVTAVMIANGAHIGGGMNVAPGADPTDGRLDVVVIGAKSRAGLLAWLPTLYWGGHVRSKDVTVTRASTVTIDATPPAPVHVDGEPLGTTPVTISIRPRALRVRR